MRIGTRLSSAKSVYEQGLCMCLMLSREEHPWVVTAGCDYSQPPPVITQIGLLRPAFRTLLLFIGHLYGVVTFLGCCPAIPRFSPS